MCVFKHKKIPLLPPGHHDGRTSARSTHLRRALIHRLLRLSPPPHTPSHKSPSTALSLSSCSSTKCPSLSTPGHGLCSIPSIIRRAEGDNATRSRHSLSLSSRAHSTHKGLQHSNHLYYSSPVPSPSSCLLHTASWPLLSSPNVFLLSPSLSHTHVGSTHTRSTHTPENICKRARHTPLGRA